MRLSSFIADTLKTTGGLLLVAVLFYLLLLFSEIGCSGHRKAILEKPWTPSETEKTSPSPIATIAPDAVPTPSQARHYTFAPVYFDFDRHNLRGDARQTISLHVVQMLHGAGKGKTFLLEGHADERGTNEYNLALGQCRADAVKSGLVEYGIAPSRLRTASYGEEKPVDGGHDETAWQANRRVEFKGEN